MLSEEQLDQLIAQVVKEMVESVKPPDIEAGWKRLKRRIRLRRAKRLAVRSAAIAAVLVLCFGTLEILAPQPVRAFGHRVWSGFATIIQGDQATLLIGCTDKPNPKPPVPPQTIIRPGNDSLQAIAARSPFPIQAPQYLPPGYTLARATYSPLNKKNAMVELRYSSGKHSLVFVQWNAGDQGMGYGYDIQDTAVSDVTVGSHPGKQFYRQKDGFTQLIWADGEISYRIGGLVSPQEMLSIVSSLQEVKND